ncbi:MAG: hypothetical protein J5855_03660 [Mailhella sp.]|nr:hypothetical protein [Mailhella sp.]
MASDKKVVLLFTGCEASAILEAGTPALAKLLGKGVALTNVSAAENFRQAAAAGNKDGQAIWEAAEDHDFVVTGLSENFDMCVLDAEADAASVEAAVAGILEVAGRNTVVAHVAPKLIVFYGPGFAKGKSIDAEYCPCTVAATVAYVANFPLPANCAAPVCYAALKDINYKFNEIKKLQESITNMEAAMERQSRKPWDKHDCA